MTLSSQHALGAAESPNHQQNVILSSGSSQDWCGFGKFVARMRQRRRQLKLKYERLSAKMHPQEYTRRAAEWRSIRRWICRHGVFWLCRGKGKCPCMSLERVDANAWHGARWMPCVDSDLRVDVVTKFCASRFQRIGCVRAEVRRRRW